MRPGWRPNLTAWEACGRALTFRQDIARAFDGDVVNDQGDAGLPVCRLVDLLGCVLRVVCRVACYTQQSHDDTRVGKIAELAKCLMI
jgi:hypothetical protein